MKTHTITEEWIATGEWHPREKAPTSDWPTDPDWNAACMSAGKILGPRKYRLLRRVVDGNAGEKGRTQ